MTPADIIVEVRHLLQDSVVPYRFSDTYLLGFVNQSVKRMSVLRPDLFGSIQDIPTQADSAVQTLPSDALRLIDIFQVKGGNAVTEVDRETMNRNYPNWMNEASGSPVNFMRHVKNEDRFFLYPPPSSGTVLVGEYAVTPPDYTLSQIMTAPSDAFFPSLVDCTVFLAESIDDEHVNSGRAQAFLDSFVKSLAASMKSRELTDTKFAAMRPSKPQINLGDVI